MLSMEPEGVPCRRKECGQSYRASEHVADHFQKFKLIEPRPISVGASLIEMEGNQKEDCREQGNRQQADGERTDQLGMEAVMRKQPCAKSGDGIGISVAGCHGCAWKRR